MARFHNIYGEMLLACMLLFGPLSKSNAVNIDSAPSGFASQIATSCGKQGYPCGGPVDMSRGEVNALADADPDVFVSVQCPSEGPCFEGVAPSTNGSQPVATSGLQMVSGTFCAQTQVAQALAAHNGLRRARGIGPLLCVEASCNAATSWSKTMAQRGQIGHDHVRANCQASGFVRACAENVLMNYDIGHDAGQKATRQWANSAGHYKNIMNPQYKRVGLGYVIYGRQAYWTGIFGG